jgi:CheY-like chemotaxis protein
MNIAAAPVSPLRPPSSAGMKVDFSRIRFLLVDDNIYMRRMLRSLLTGFDARIIHEAEDGAAGLEAIRIQMPDIVIADWEMPMLDGIEMTRFVRQSATSVNPFLPIIMMTGHAEKKRVLTARDAGVTEFLVKPISAHALYNRVLNIVANPRPFVRTKSYFGPDRRRMTKDGYRGPERRRSWTNDVIPATVILDKMRD